MAQSKELAESEKSRQGNSDVDGENVYAAAFMASVGNLKFTDKESCPWLIDSGASCHMTKDKHVLANFQEFEGPENVAIGDGRVLKALGSGRVQMNMPQQLRLRKLSCMMCSTCLNSLATCFLYEL